MLLSQEIFAKSRSLFAFFYRVGVLTPRPTPIKEEVFELTCLLLLPIVFQVIDYSQIAE